MFRGGIQEYSKAPYLERTYHSGQANWRSGTSVHRAIGTKALTCGKLQATRKPFRVQALFLTKRQIALASVIVLLHFAVLLVHGAGHKHLSINMSGWENAFIAMVIFASPLVAMGLLFLRRQKAGAILLGLSLLGALVFGVWYHFIVPGSDNVFGMAGGAWERSFFVSSVLLAATEAAGCLWSFWALRRPQVS